MRTGLGIAPRIRLASPRLLPEITAHSRLISLFPGRGVPSGAAVAGVFRHRQLVPVDEPQARGCPCPWVPGRETAGPGRRPK